MQPEIAAPAAPPSVDPAAPVVQLAPDANPTQVPSATSPAAEPAVPAGEGQPGLPPPAAVVPAPAAAPAVSPEMAEYVEFLEQTAADAQSKETVRVISQAAAGFAQKLQDEQGLSPEQANYIARREAQQTLREVRSQEFRQGQINAAFDIGQRHGVDPRMLMSLPTPQAMEQAAAQSKAQGSVVSEIARLRAENEALKKKAVPPGSYAAPGVSATPAPGSYIEALKGGKPLPTAKEIDAYTAQYLSGSR